VVTLPLTNKLSPKHPQLKHRAETIKADATIVITANPMYALESQSMPTETEGVNRGVSMAWSVIIFGRLTSAVFVRGMMEEHVHCCH
jgi:hypothetical protein